jgi:hypothetical protein
MNLYCMCILNVLSPKIKQTCLFYLLQMQRLVNALPFAIRRDVYLKVPMCPVDAIILCLEIKHFGQVYLRHLFCPITYFVHLQFTQPLHVVQRYCEAQNYMSPLPTILPTSFNVLY